MKTSRPATLSRRVQAAAFGLALFAGALSTGSAFAQTRVAPQSIIVTPAPVPAPAAAAVLYARLGLPLYPGAVLSRSGGKRNDDKDFEATFTTGASVTAVADYYRAFLEARGWTVRKREVKADKAQLDFRKGKDKLKLEIKREGGSLKLKVKFDD